MFKWHGVAGDGTMKNEEKRQREEEEKWVGGERERKKDTGMGGREKDEESP